MPGAAAPTSEACTGKRPLASPSRAEPEQGGLCSQALADTNRLWQRHVQQSKPRAWGRGRMGSDGQKDMGVSSESLLAQCTQALSEPWSRGPLGEPGCSSTWGRLDGKARRQAEAPSSVCSVPAHAT